MTIASEITRIQTAVANCYTSVEEKGGTLPEQQNIANLAEAINSISGGGSSYSIPKTINDDGELIFDATAYSASPATKIGTNGLQYAFYGQTTLQSLDLSTITAIGPSGVQYICNGCTGLTSVDFSNLENIHAYSLDHAFYGCTNLITVDFPKLNLFKNSMGYEMQYTFGNCKNIEHVYFRALNSQSFPYLTSSKRQMYYMMYGTGTNIVHKLHFPSNMQSIISQLYGYPLFNGTDGYVQCLFDLPATS